MEIVAVRERRIDVGILTVIPTEISAVFNIFRVNARSRLNIKSPLDYWYTNVTTKDGAILDVVISFLPGEAGNTEAAVTTTQFLRDWYPNLMCLVGIAAGISSKSCVGDVVIPTKIHDRTVRVFSRGEFSYRTASHGLADTVRKALKIEPVSVRSVKEQMDTLFPDEEKIVSEIASAKLAPGEFSEEPRILDGSLITDNVLIWDPAYFDRVADILDEKCRGGEMEAAGFVRSCQVERADFPWLVLRGISDFGDARKDDAFQVLAARRACVTLRILLEESLDARFLSDNPRDAFANATETVGENLLGQLRSAHRAKRWREACRIGVVLSRPLWLSGHHESRLEVGRLVDSAAAAIGDGRSRARALVDDLGWTSYKLGETDDARRFVNDGIELGKKHHDYYSVAKGYRHLAAIERDLGNLDASQGHLANSGKYAKKINDKGTRDEMAASLMASSAKLDFARGHAVDALGEAEDAQKEFYRIGDDERAAKVYSFIGKVQTKLDKLDLARQSYLAGRTKTKKLGRFDEYQLNTELLVELVRPHNQAEALGYADDAIGFALEFGLWSEARRWEEIRQHLV